MTNQEVVNRMVEMIASRFHPDKIILFGSYASGTFTKDSDVDLLVVMQVEGSKRQKASDIDLALAGRTLPLDVIVVTPDEVEKYHDTIGSLIYPALKEGKVVYERVA